MKHGMLSKASKSITDSGIESNAKTHYGLLGKSNYATAECHLEGAESDDIDNTSHMRINAPETLKHCLFMLRNVIV